jgi:hypothetical protein
MEKVPLNFVTIPSDIYIYIYIVLCTVNYRMNRKEIYTFKMTQKTIAAYLQLHTYTSG